MSKWIKCSERLPKDETDVLVAVYGTDVLTVEDDSFESLQKAIEDSRKSVRYTTMACYISGDGWYENSEYEATPYCPNCGSYNGG